MAEADCSVLSIQSTVVWGYVGNKSASFPLQVLGFDVSTINSVQFSNHTGYGKFKGQVLNSQDVSDLYEGLKVNDITHFSHILTGYIGNKSFLEKVADIIRELKQQNPKLIFVCDPVMGDNGKMYVPAELLPVYRDTVIPLADIVTPNQFELEQLTGTTVHTEEDALRAMKMLHDKGVVTVVLSSSAIGGPSKLVCVASTIANGHSECYKIEIPHLPVVLVGTGDLFAAVLLAWLHKDQSLKMAFEKTLSTLQAVIKRTVDNANRLAGPGSKPTSCQLELRMIQSKSDIENPQISFHAQPISLPK